MYKLIIVDDELRILSGLEKYYDWENLGFTVCAKFQDGQDALKYLKDHSIDVVLTDISMPTIDGLSLAKIIFEEYPSIITVFLSGYADFEYATQALRYRVYDYILKPVKSEDLYTIFQRIRNTLDQTHSKENSNNYYECIIVKAKKYMADHLSSVTLLETALHTGLSPSYFSTIYKQFSGRSFSEELLQMKMETSKSLLLTSTLKTYEIAEKLGYDNPKNFTRAFRAYFGFSPRELRKDGGTHNDS